MKDTDAKMKIIIEKIRIGSSITDAELTNALAFYTSAERHLNILGPHFHLAWVNVAITLDRLKSYDKARKERATA